MNNETNYVSNRLLFTAEPFANESFIGYLLRLCELNEFESLAWMVELAALRTVRDENFNLYFDARQNLKTLAALSNVAINKLQSLLYQFNHSGRTHPSLISGEVIFYGEPVPRYFIRREKARVCPACLQEQNYLKRIWEFAPATCCPLHKHLLLDACSACKNPLAWNRRQVSVCNCGCDFRNEKSAEIPDCDVRVTRQIYWLCGLLNVSNENLLPVHLEVLDLAELLKVLFFIISHFNHALDLDGYLLGSQYDNRRLHHQLTHAARVFDDFPSGFYEFLSWLRNQSEQIKCVDHLPSVRNFDYRYQYDKKLTGFNVLLEHCLSEVQFDFTRQAFHDFIARNHVNILKC